jgi:hypothetical protein
MFNPAQDALERVGGRTRRQSAVDLLARAPPGYGLILNILKCESA